MELFKIIVDFEVVANDQNEAVKLLKKFIEAHENINFDSGQKQKVELNFECEADIKIYVRENIH